MPLAVDRHVVAAHLGQLFGELYAREGLRAAHVEQRAMRLDVVNGLVQRRSGDVPHDDAVNCAGDIGHRHERSSGGVRIGRRVA